MLHITQINELLHEFNNRGISLCDLLSAVLHKGFDSHPFRRDLSLNLNTLLQALWQCSDMQVMLRTWCHGTMKKSYYQSAKSLTRTIHGWHMSVSHITPEDVLQFRIEEMAKSMRQGAPELWDLVGHLVSGDMSWNMVQDEDEDEELDMSTGAWLDEDEDEDSPEIEASSLPPGETAEASVKMSRNLKRQHRLRRIVRVAESTVKCLADKFNRKLS